MERRIWGSPLSTSSNKTKRRGLLNIIKPGVSGSPSIRHKPKARMPLSISPVTQKKTKIKFMKMRLPLLLVFILSAAYYFFFISSFFNVKEVEISGVKTEESIRIYDIINNEIQGKK